MKKEILAYTLADFAQAVAQATKEGYELDLVSNENYPVQIGVSTYLAGMVKPVVQVEQQEEEVTTSTTIDAGETLDEEEPEEEVQAPKQVKPKKEKKIYPKQTTLLKLD